MVDCIGGSEIIQQLLAELAKSNRLIISAESQLVACEKELAFAKKDTAWECIELCSYEYVGKDTEDDRAYNRGIDDCIAAIRAKYGVE